MARTLRIALAPLRSLPRRVGQVESLDPVARAVATAVNRLAPGGSPLNATLSGTDIGHPLHPLLTDVVVGAWTSAVALDWLGPRGAHRAADRLIGLGVVAAAPTVAAGFNDWATLAGPDRRLGLVHAATNLLATGAFGASWLARTMGYRSIGRSLALGAYGVIGIGAFLGGHLAFSRAAGVDHTVFDRVPGDWTVVAGEESLEDSTPVLVRADGVDIMLVREGGVVHALHNRCAHQGGPLHEGEIQSGCVVCPWHKSRYRLSDGAALSGPTAHSQPKIEVRVRDGQVEVRRPASL